MAITLYKHGKRIVTYGVTQLPNRKRYCLYKMDDNQLTPLTWFTHDEHAQEFEEFLHFVVSGGEASETNP